jgi:hypothetical protein
MTPPRHPSDDTGAALVVALIFVTVVGLVTSVLLSFGDASMRATVGLRQQSAQAYTADGAAQIAINTLRTQGLPDAAASPCPREDRALVLPDFPSASASSPAGSAVVCETVLSSGTISQGSLSQANTPENAILTLGKASAQEPGILLQSVSRTDGFSSDGAIRSNSSILVQRGALTSDSGISALPDYCFTVGSAQLSCSSQAPQADPSYPAPRANPSPRDVPSCPKSGGVVTFTPGLYTDASALSACDDDTLWFRPGTYYFNFQADAPTWTLDSGSLVAGTPTAALTSHAPTMPGSCVSPLRSTKPSAGVEFVFGGVSNMVVANSARAELCGSYSRIRPPIAVYGLKSADGAVPAQSGCITARNGCPLISSGDYASDNAMYVQGTVYAPRAALALSYGQSQRLATGQFIGDGIVARSVSVLLDGVSPTGVSVPDENIGPPGDETIVLLKVYVCAGDSTCSPGSGRLQIEAKVGVSNPPEVLAQSLQSLQSSQSRLSTGAAVSQASGARDDPAGLVPGARTVDIFSWAVRRCRVGSSASCQS